MIERMGGRVMGVMNRACPVFLVFAVAFLCYRFWLYGPVIRQGMLEYLARPAVIAALAVVGYALWLLWHRDDVRQSVAAPVKSRGLQGPYEGRL